MPDLQYFLDQQSALQQVMEEKNGSPHPTRLFRNFFAAPNSETEAAHAVELIKMMQWNDKALIHEMVEMEAETGWKPWAKSAHVNLEAARGEWIDMLHFLLNGALLLGLDAEMIQARYDAKHAKNEQRQNENYDGVSTKCAGCGRALDDDAVECRIVHEDTIRAQFWCDVHQDYIYKVKKVL
jgi:hypothetical protein